METGGQGQAGLQAFFDQPFAFDEDQVGFAPVAHAPRVFQSFVGGTGDGHEGESR